MPLHLVQGPAGGGKSQVTAEMLEAGEVQVVADVTALWAALSGAVRGPDGRYPVRDESDPALAAALYAQSVIARNVLDSGADVAVTTSRAGQEARWREVAGERGLFVRTVDPGEETVRARLAESDGSISPECDKAVRRWYG